MFETSDKSGSYIPAIHLCFKRGVRLDRPTVRRIQDQLYIVLATFGVGSQISRIPGVGTRQVRNIGMRDGEMETDAAMRLMAIECQLRGDGWLKRVRDAIVAFLGSLGMNSEDIASTIQFHRHPINVRQRIADTPPAIASRVSAGAWRVRREIEPLLDSERARRETEPRSRIPRRRTNARRPRAIAMPMPPDPARAVAVA